MSVRRDGVVGIVGAGIGGLTLAHALRRRGIRCVVVDRDAGPADTGGYRLHLTPDAFAALTEVLPASSMRALRSCGAGADAFRQFAVLDHRGGTLLRIPISHAGEVLLIGRRPLRAILARGLADTIHWNTPVTGFTATGTGVRLNDGREVDLLVVADGAGSRLAGQWIGRPTAQPAGVTGIAGRAPLPQRIPADLRHGLAFMIGPGGVGAFLSLHDRPGNEPESEAPYVVWSVAARTEAVESGLETRARERVAGAGGLVDRAHELTAGWSRDFHTLLDHSEPGSVAAFPFSFPAALAPWPDGRVTVLGDAIHPMPPTGGAGASTAILDAVHLAADLAGGPLPEALAAYRARLLGYAPTAVDESRPPLLWQQRLAHPLSFALATRLVLPTVGALTTLWSRRPRAEAGFGGP